MKKAIWIKADGTEIEVKPKNGTDFQLEELKEFVRAENVRAPGYGGTIITKSVATYDTIQILELYNKDMVINDDGRLIGLKKNEKATKEWNAMDRMGPIVGNVLICDKGMVR